MKLRALLLIAALALSVACGDESAEPAAPGGAPVGDTVTGIITSVESSGLNKVSSFTIKEDDGNEHEILIDPDVDYGFPLGHLEEHRVGAHPVEVGLDQRDGELYATSILDV